MRQPRKTKENQKMPAIKTSTDRHKEQASSKLSDEDRAIIIWLASLGFQYKRIAALFDINMGRVAEVVVKSGLMFQYMNKGDTEK